MHLRCSVLLFISICLAVPQLAVCQTAVTFDFDSSTPALTLGKSTPFDQSSAGLTASFNSLTGLFSVQSDGTTGWKISKFSGNYLSSSPQTKCLLSIKFSQPLRSVSLTFATSDFEIEKPSPLQLTAYMDTNVSPAVGTATARGTYDPRDTMPTGTLSFSSGSQFNLIEVVLPFQTGGAAAFVIDTITATPFWAFSVVSAASYESAAPLAPNSIASGFGQGLAERPEAASAQPLPLNLANTTVTLTDSTGAARPAPLYYAGPTQINYLVPEATALGPAAVTVTSGGRVAAVAYVKIEAVAPGFFTANADGKGVPLAWAILVAPDLAQTVQAVSRCGSTVGSCVPSPIDLGPAGTQAILSLYGTGIRGRSSLGSVQAKVGGLSAEVRYAGLQSEFAGLDQLDLVIPRALAGQGEVDVIVTVDGKAANTVRINVK
jgi:uncharacterized protein (TIGR03437 family)